MKQPKGSDRPSVLAVLVMVAVLAAIMVLYADRMYGDWTCAFTRCVKVKP